MSASASEKKFELLLAAVIAARATAFIFSKILLRDLGAFNLPAVRFIIAFILLSLIFFRDIVKADKKTLLAGVTVGTLFFLTVGSEMFALKSADVSLVSLLENCTIIFVPLFGIAIDRRLPEKTEMLSAVIAMAGVVLLALKQGNLRGGFFFGLLAAVFYASAIIATARLTRKNVNTVAMGIIQIGTMGALSLIVSLIFESPVLPQTGAQWGMLAVLVIVCTGFGFTLQPVAQSHVSETRAGLFCAISPAVASLLGVVVLHERLGLLGIAGLALILFSIVLPYLFVKKQEKI